MINGGAGADRITGRGGPDEFYYGSPADSPPDAPDVIVDFDAEEGDFLELSALGVTKVASGSLGSSPEKSVRLRRVNGDGVVEIDLDDDPEPEMRIILKNLGAFGRTNFRLLGDPRRTGNGG